MRLFFNSDGTPTLAALLVILALIVVLPGVAVGRFANLWLGLGTSVAIAAVIVGILYAFAQSFKNG